MDHTVCMTSVAQMGLTNCCTHPLISYYTHEYDLTWVCQALLRTIQFDRVARIMIWSSSWASKRLAIRPSTWKVQDHTTSSTVFSFQSRSLTDYSRAITMNETHQQPAIFQLSWWVVIKRSISRKLSDHAVTITSGWTLIDLEIARTSSIVVSEWWVE